MWSAIALPTGPCLFGSKAGSTVATLDKACRSSRDTLPGSANSSLKVLLIIMSTSMAERSLVRTWEKQGRCGVSVDKHHNRQLEIGAGHKDEIVAKGDNAASHIRGRRSV